MGRKFKTHDPRTIFPCEFSGIWQKVAFAFYFSLFPLHFLEAEPFIDSVSSAAKEIATLLPQVRAKAEDLSIRPRWHLPHTIPAVEQLLHSPLQASVHLASWSAMVSEFTSFVDFADFSSAMLSSGALLSDPSPLRKETPLPASVPLEIRDSVSCILEAIQTASPLLGSSYQLLTEGEQEQLLSLHEFFGVRLFTPRQKRKIFQAMEKFNQNGLLAAGRILLKALAQEIPKLENFSKELDSRPARIRQASGNDIKKNFQQILIQTDIGKILISGKNDDTYNAETLKEVVLLIDLGGKNSYEGQVAGAKKGEIKIAIDFGEEVTIKSTEPVSAGAGVFGIGFLFLMNPAGKNNVNTASYSQGAGICGMGALFVSGSGNFFAERYAQGAGVFGIGIFDAGNAHHSTFTAHKYAQGVGFCRALGIFRAKSANSIFQAGLVDPDPREPLGMTSLCQGVGFGPRGYAGGGLGICTISGNQNTIESSYFAQGTGYWRAAGTFFLQGNSNKVQARRYDQGSGVHSAIGSFFVKGNQNRILNWGVGPAYGWDAGISWVVVLGNENSIQAEWGTGSATFGRSRSFSFISGVRNRLNLPSFGSALYLRDFTDYALHIVKGTENQFFHSHFEKGENINGNLFVSPWGIVRFSSALLTKKIEPSLPVAEWQKFSQKTSLKDSVHLRDELKSAFSLSGKEKVEKLLQVASAFGGEKNIAREALAQIVFLPSHELALLPELLDPQDVEGFIQIRSAIGIQSDFFFPVLAEQVKRLAILPTALPGKLREEQEEKKAVLLSLFSLQRIGDAVPLLMELLEKEDWRIQSSIVRSLGNLFNRDKGTIPGRIAILRALHVWLKTFFPSKRDTEELIRHLTNRPFAETVAILSTLRNWTAEEKILFLKNAPEDINGPFEREKLKELLPLLRKNKREILKILQHELEDFKSQAFAVREKLKSLLHQNVKQEGLVHSCLVALGQIGDVQDAELLSRYLTHSSALVRDAASAALGRIGAGAKLLLERIFAEGNTEEKIQALLACMTTSDSALLAFFRKVVKDADPKVRKVALSLLNHFQFPLQKEAEKLKKVLAEEMDEDDRIQQLYLWK